MKHELFPSMENLMNAHVRLSVHDEIRGHFSQYGTNSDFVNEARRRTISSIVDLLGISEREVPWHDKNEVNITLMMLLDERPDLAKDLWTDPKKFKKENADIFTKGIERIDIIFDGRLTAPEGKKIIGEWQELLKKES